jgi:uncharacterized protein YecT (DUF1311 family)
MKTILVSLFIMLPSIANAASKWDMYGEGAGNYSTRVCNDGNTIEINECLADVLAQADTELNRVYKIAMAQLRQEAGSNSPPVTESTQMKSLKAAQRTWVKLRDADRGLAEAGFEGGSIATSAGLSRAIAVTMDRVSVLQMIAQYSFTKEAKLAHLLGRWVDPVNELHWYRFSSNNGKVGEYECKGPSGSHKGQFTNNAGSWEFSGGGCDSRNSESILFTWLSGGDLPAIKFVHDGGSVTALLVRQQ